MYAARLGEEEEGPEDNTPQETKLGMNVQGISPDVADRLSIPANKGVLVTEVKPGSFADDVGLVRGDVILEVNKQAVNNEEEFRKMQTQLKSGEDVVFLVRQGRGRNSGTAFLGGTLP
jgi:serine protease Do